MDNVIDLAQRASELRIKNTLTGTVEYSEALTSLALGLMHLKGDGVRSDPAKAARFLATAAKGGIAQAKHELALLHLKGRGVAYDAACSIRLLLSAADEGYLPSTISLAELYLFGKHCPQDTETALEMLLQVAGEDEPAIMYYLAYIYDHDCNYQNAIEAAYWYRRAAEYGHFKSQIRIASCYATGCGVPLCRETAEAFLKVALQATAEQDPRFLLWQGERLGAEPETEFLAQALIKAAAQMSYTPARRVLLERGWRH